MATAAAAIIAKARRRIFDHLMGANAVSPESAVEFEPSGMIPTRQFQRLQNKGVVRATDDNRYWVDIPTYRDWSNVRRRRLAAVAVIVTAAAAAGAIVASMGGVAG
jgi:NDP-sugar pyrophosphorylase family protein